MEKTFIIVDDDAGVRKMLAMLIRKNRLGKVICELDSGKNADEEILFYNPDIVLVDLLLPVRDGIEVINSVRKKGYKGKFIMISQVEDEKMVARAYESGIVFFIDKPINSIEAINVIKGVCRNIDLERSLAMVKHAVMDASGERFAEGKPTLEKRINDIFKDIGIVGTVGSRDLFKLICKVHDLKLKAPHAEYQLQDIYEEIVKEQGEVEGGKLNVRTLEQRIRRTIQKALQTLAELGHGDYGNDIFIQYATLLFDFTQVRQQMRHIENPSEEPGKINIKKFIEGIVSKLNYS